MAAHNRITLIGRVTNDPERRSLSNCDVVNFRLAVGRSKKNPQTGQWENDPNTLFIDCAAFDYPDAKRKLGKVVTDYVKKGDPLFIEGRLAFEQWDDKASGQKRSKHKVIVESVELLGSKGGNGNGGGSMPDEGGGSSGGYTPPAASGGGWDDDSIPF